jgi:hypothetical protein
MQNPYTQEEVISIEQKKDKNDRLEEYFSQKRESWSKQIDPLFNGVDIKFFNKNNVENIIQTQALALSYRQILTEEISFFLNKRSKEEVEFKKLKQDKFLYYAIGFGLKTNMGEKMTLIEAHVAEWERNMNLLENHVEFLRQCNKNLESLGFTIKNITELLTYLSH